MQTVWRPRAGEQPLPSSRELLGSGEQEGDGSDGCTRGTGGWEAGAKPSLCGRKVYVPVNCVFIFVGFFFFLSQVLLCSPRWFHTDDEPCLSLSAVCAIVAVLLGCS